MFKRSDLMLLRVIGATRGVKGATSIVWRGKGRNWYSLEGERVSTGIVWRGKGCNWYSLEGERVQLV